MNTMIKTFLKELEQEAQTTRKFLALAPDDQYDYKPHAKSMVMKNLIAHIAELPDWISLAMHTNGLDFAENPYQPTDLKNNAELLGLLEKSVTEGRNSLLAATNDEQLEPKWILRNGEVIILERTKAEVIRMSINQIIHHRAQLGVYLRLLNIPIPGSYGPSADEMEQKIAPAATA